MNEEDYERSKTYTLIWDQNQIQRFRDLFTNDLDSQNVKLMYMAAIRYHAFLRTNQESRKHIKIDTSL